MAAKSRGELLAKIFDHEPLMLDDDSTPWMGRVAAKYDNARTANIPPDVLAFVEEVEGRASKATLGPWTQPLEDEPRAIAAESRPRMSLLGLDVDGMVIVESVHDAHFIRCARVDVPRLCQIVREQAAELRTFRDDFCVVPCGKCKRSIIGVDQGLASCPRCERDALLERFAKLESAARKLHAAPFDSDAWRELGALLPDATTNRPNEAPTSALNEQDDFAGRFGY